MYTLFVISKEDSGDVTYTSPGIRLPPEILIENLQGEITKILRKIEGKISLLLIWNLAKLKQAKDVDLSKPFAIMIEKRINIVIPTPKNKHELPRLIAKADDVCTFDYSERPFIKGETHMGVIYEWLKDVRDKVNPDLTKQIIFSGKKKKKRKLDKPIFPAGPPAKRRRVIIRLDQLYSSVFLKEAISAQDKLPHVLYLLDETKYARLNENLAWINEDELNESEKKLYFRLKWLLFYVKTTMDNFKPPDITMPKTNLPNNMVQKTLFVLLPGVDITGSGEAKLTHLLSTGCNLNFVMFRKNYLCAWDLQHFRGGYKRDMQIFLWGNIINHLGYQMGYKKLLYDINLMILSTRKVQYIYNLKYGVERPHTTVLNAEFHINIDKDSFHIFGFETTFSTAFKNEIDLEQFKRKRYGFYHRDIAGYVFSKHNDMVVYGLSSLGHMRDPSLGNVENYINVLIRREFRHDPVNENTNLVILVDPNSPYKPLLYDYCIIGYIYWIRKKIPPELYQIYNTYMWENFVKEQHKFYEKHFAFRFAYLKYLHVQSIFRGHMYSKPLLDNFHRLLGALKYKFSVLSPRKRAIKIYEAYDYKFFNEEVKYMMCKMIGKRHESFSWIDRFQWRVIGFNSEDYTRNLHEGDTRYTEWENYLDSEWFMFYEYDDFNEIVIDYKEGISEPMSHLPAPSKEVIEEYMKKRRERFIKKRK